MRQQYDDLIHLILLLEDQDYPFDSFLDRWERINYRTFSDAQGRLLLRDLHSRLIGKYPRLLESTSYTNVFLSELRFNQLMYDLVMGKRVSFRYLMADLRFLADFTLSAESCHRIVSFLIFALQHGYSKYALEIIKDFPWVAVHSDALNDNTCVCAYAIEYVPEDEVVCAMLETVQPSPLGDMLYLNGDLLPEVAVRSRRFHILKYLFDRKLCSEEYALAYETVIQRAVSTGDRELLVFALGQLHHDPDLYYMQKVTPLALAIEKDDLVVAEILLEHGAHIIEPQVCPSEDMLKLLNKYNVEVML